MAGGDKEHVEKIRKSKFNRQTTKTDELRDNCNGEGYVFAKKVVKGGKETVNGARQCEFHHVLPISSLQDGAILGGKETAANMEFIHKCMAKTTWNTNKQPNLLGLPTKKPFQNADYMTSRKKDRHTLEMLVSLDPGAGKFGALPNLPCHLNDHQKYTDKIITVLDSDLWPELKAARKECKDKGKSIRNLLINFSKTWKDWLKTRGGLHGGAADCWVNRKKKAAVWYIPLSMAPRPTKVKPPPNIHELTSNIRNWLESMFSKVKF